MCEDFVQAKRIFVRILYEDIDEIYYLFVGFSTTLPI